MLTYRLYFHIIYLVKFSCLRTIWFWLGSTITFYYYCYYYSFKLQWWRISVLSGLDSCRRHKIHSLLKCITHKFALTVPKKCQFLAVYTNKWLIFHNGFMFFLKTRLFLLLLKNRSKWYKWLWMDGCHRSWNYDASVGISTSRPLSWAFFLGM